MQNQGQQKVRAGSSMSSKQLARTVIDGRKVTFRFIPEGEQIEGYLAGMDDFHWLVVTPEGSKHLIHKGSAPIIDLADTATYNDEIKKSLLEEVVAPFRRHIEKTFFGRQTKDDPASEERVVAAS